MAEAITRFGRYEIRGELGKGGFATVFRAWDAALGREVALKALQPHLALDANIRGRFMAEARAIAQLHHPNIITVYEVDEAGGRPFFTMELVNGPTLAALVAPGQGLPLGRVAEIMRSLASAVDYLHTRRLVHRDIKASNVMLDAWGRVVLMDFGVARAMDQTQLTQSGISIGTPEAMAPEQVRGQPAGPPADIYAIGVLSYRLLAGRAPFVGETIYVLHAHAYEPPPPLREFRSDLPESVYAALDAALAKAPQDRPISAERFATALSVPTLETTTGETTASFVRLPPGGQGESRTPTPTPSAAVPIESERNVTPALPESMRPVSGAPERPTDQPSQSRRQQPLIEATIADRDSAREAAEALAGELPRKQVVRAVEPRESQTRKGLTWSLIVGAVAILVIAGASGAVILGRHSGSNKNNAAIVGPSASATSASQGSASAQVTRSPATGSSMASATNAATVTSTATTAATAATSALATVRPTMQSPTAPPTAAPALAALLAGGKPGYAEGAGDQAQFNGPKGVAADASGNVFVTDSGNNRIRKIVAGGTTSLIAGPAASVTSAGGLADGDKSTARFNSPWGIAVDKQGNVFVADSINHRIRKIAPDGRTSIYSGNPNAQAGDIGLGGGAYKDGPAADARFNQPTGLAIDAADNLYVADTGNNRIRKITPEGTVSTLAGSGDRGGFADGKESARFNGPEGVAVDAAGNVYVSDTNNNLIRRVAPDGSVTTAAGTVSGDGGAQGAKDGLALSATFAFPSGLAVDAANNVYIADRSNHRIRRLSAEGTVSTVAGGKEGFANGTGTDAQLDFPDGLALDGSGNLYVADSSNNRIRKLAVR